MNNDVTKIHNKSNKWGFFFFEKENKTIFIEFLQLHIVKIVLIYFCSLC